LLNENFALPSQNRCRLLFISFREKRRMDSTLLVMDCEKSKNNLPLKKIKARITQIANSKIVRHEILGIDTLNFLARNTTGGGAMPDKKR
jgi:hypothetical protein